MFLEEGTLIKVKADKLVASDFGNIFKELKIAERGTNLTSDKKTVFFVKYVGIDKENKISMLEFSFLDKTFSQIYSVYMYSPKYDKGVTLLIDENKTLDDVILIIKENLNKKIKESANLFLETENTKIINKLEESIKDGKLTINEDSFTDLIRTVANGANEKEGEKPGLLRRFMYSGFGQFLISFSPVIALLLGYGYFLIKKIYLTKDQYYAQRSAEDELNAFLFQGQKKDEPAFDTYSNINQHLYNLIKGNSNGVILYGMPGTSKSYLVRRALYFSDLKPQVDYAIFKGGSADSQKNIRIIYETLWRYNDKIVVFDDFDSSLQDENVINLLKAALDSYPVRIVSLPDTGYYADQEIPSKFRYTGRIILITNKTGIDTALKSRTVAIPINYSNEEFKDQIEKMLKFVNPHIDYKLKEEVFEYISRIINKKDGAIIDMRRFSSIIDLAVAYPKQWKELALEVLYPNKKK